MKFQILRFFDDFFRRRVLATEYLLKNIFRKMVKICHKKKITDTRLVLPRVHTKLGNGRRLV